MPVKASELLAMAEGQNFRCNLSRVELSPQMSSLDHKQPVCHGGSNDIDNLQVLHPVVNYAKARMTNTQFISMCHAVARANEDPHDDSWAFEMTAPKGSE